MSERITLQEYLNAVDEEGFKEIQVMFPDVTLETWMWCLHCERVFQVKHTRISKMYGEVFALCPYNDCDGDLLDFRKYTEYRGEHLAVLATPKVGERYPLYLK